MTVTETRKAIINFEPCSFTLIDFETDVFERGVVTAFDLSQDLHDAFYFGTLELDENDSIKSEAEQQIYRLT